MAAAWRRKMRKLATHTDNNKDTARSHQDVIACVHAWKDNDDMAGNRYWNSRWFPAVSRPERNKINDLAKGTLGAKVCARVGCSFLASWHPINCLLLGLSLVEKFVCYCVKCYLCAHVQVSGSLAFLSLLLCLCLCLSIVYHFRSPFKEG